MQLRGSPALLGEVAWLMALGHLQRLWIRDDLTVPAMWLRIAFDMLRTEQEFFARGRAPTRVADVNMGTTVVLVSLPVNDDDAFVRDSAHDDRVDVAMSIVSCFYGTSFLNEHMSTCQFEVDPLNSQRERQQKWSLAGRAHQGIALPRLA